MRLSGTGRSRVPGITRSPVDNLFASQLAPTSCPDCDSAAQWRFPRRAPQPGSRARWAAADEARNQTPYNASVAFSRAKAAGRPGEAGQPFAELEIPTLSDAQQSLTAAQAAVHEDDAGIQVARNALHLAEVLSRDGSRSRLEVGNVFCQRPQARKRSTISLG